MRVFQLVLPFVLAAANTLAGAEGIVGSWEGELRMGKRSMRLVFDVTEHDAGGVGAKASFPDQGVRDLSVDGVLYNDPEIFIEFDQFGGVYRGVYKPDSDQIEGKWHFHTMRGPMSDTEMALSRVTRQRIEPDALNYDYLAGEPVLMGYWKAAVKVPPNVELDFVLKIGVDDEGGLHGFLDIPQQGGNNIPVQDIGIDSSQVEMNFPGLGLRFKGLVEADGDRLTGEFDGFQRQLEAVFDRLSELPGNASQLLSFEPTGPKDAKGYWQGTLEVQGTKLRLAVAIGVNDDGKHQATMDSLDQRSFDIPASVAIIEDGNYELKWSAIGATYSGSVDDDGETLDGTFKQGPLSVPLKMKRQVGPVKR